MTDLPHPAALNSSRPSEKPLPTPVSTEIQNSPPAGDVAAPRADGARPFARSRLKLGFGSRCVFYSMVATLHLMSLLPDFILRPLGVFGGLIGYWLDRRHVQIGLKNLKVAFPDKSVDQRRRILRDSYVNLGRCGAEYIRLGGFFYRRLKRRVVYERFWVWGEVATRHPGKGILVLGAHFGNFELMLATHTMLGYQIGLVHHTQRFLAGDALITFVRERAGVEVIRKHAAARPVLRALRANQIVGIPFDQNAKRSEAVFVPFFGELAATTSGLARLVQIAGAPVVPVFIVRQPDQVNHRLIIGDEIPIQRSADPRADIEENTGRFVKAIEDMVRQYPEQFLWTHRRFRTRPRGSAKIYS